MKKKIGNQMSLIFYNFSSFYQKRIFSVGEQYWSSIFFVFISSLIFLCDVFMYAAYVKPEVNELKGSG